LAKSTTQLAQNILDVLKASVSSVDFTETTMVNYISQFEGIIALLKKHTSDLNITEQNMLLTQASSNIKLGTLVNDLNSKLFTAENEYKKAQMAYDTLVSTSNDLSIKLAEKNLLEAQKRLSYSKLKAPADGVILSLNGHE
jgi:multidrug resistance efflux pump